MELILHRTCNCRPDQQASEHIEALIQFRERQSDGSPAQDLMDLTGRVGDADFFPVGESVGPRRALIGWVIAVAVGLRWIVSGDVRINAERDFIGEGCHRPRVGRRRHVPMQDSRDGAVAFLVVSELLPGNLNGVLPCPLFRRRREHGDGWHVLSHEQRFRVVERRQFSVFELEGHYWITAVGNAWPIITALNDAFSWLARCGYWPLRDFFAVVAAAFKFPDIASAKDGISPISMVSVESASPTPTTSAVAAELPLAFASEIIEVRCVLTACSAA